jgi:CBS domain-containing protein
MVGHEPDGADEEIAMTSVAEVMTREVICADAEMTVFELDRLLVDQRVSGAPVLDDGLIVGVISIVDVLRAIAQEQLDPQRVSAFYLSPFSLALPSLEQLVARRGTLAGQLADWRVRDFMSTQLVIVSSSDPVVTAAQRMMDHKVHRLLVIDDRTLAGIVTAFDLLPLVATACAPPCGEQER